MKKILICIPDFKHGGIPRCLQSLLMYIDTELYTVDLLCLSHEGPYKSQMPNCRLLPENFVVSRLMVHSKKVSWNNVLKFLPALCLKMFRVLFKRMGFDLLHSTLKNMGRKLEGYDAVIAYAEGYPAIVVENSPCENKMVWIHNDYAFSGAKGGASLTDFSKFRRICCVSKTTEISFVNSFPQFKDKACTIYNVINEEYIKEKAREEYSFLIPPQDSFNILSIGRVCAQKQFGMIPSIAVDIKNKGYKFHWYIIGGGPENEVKTVVEAIKGNNVDDCVTLLGEMDNPYKVLARSDIYVLTSLYESYPTVINEARCLRIPIVSNNIPPAYEMLKNQDGVICSLDNMAENIGVLMSGGSISGISIETMRNVKFVDGNDAVMQSFYNLVNG